MKQFIFLLLLTFSFAAYGSIYTRQHADSIVEGKKILASDLNDEFNAIATAVNTIDGSNITNGSIGINAFAATSSAISLNKKTGCTFSVISDFTGTKSVSILPPCEIFMDGIRGFITATQSISLISNLADGSLATASYYYIYATMNSSAGLGFSFSQVAPTLATAKKQTDSSARYVGTVRTCDATSDLVSIYRESANKFNWGICSDGSVPGANVIATPNVTSTIFSVPNTFQRLSTKYTVFVSGFPAQCQYAFSSADPTYQAIVIATAGATGLVPFPVNPASGFSINNISNCGVGGNLRVFGWFEPPQLHQ